MEITVVVDFERSEHAGAGGMFQIVKVEDARTGDDLTDRVDSGRHFSSDSENKECEEYLKEVFGPDVIVNLSRS